MKTRINLNKAIGIIAISTLLFSLPACEAEEEEPIIETRIVEKDVATFKLTVNMKQKVNGNDLMMNTTDKPYSNSLNQKFNVTKLRYLISDLTFYKEDGNGFKIDGYHFVDAANANSLVYEPEVRLPEGTYNKISFKFGFDRMDNAQTYPDLDAVSWGWPAGVGGVPNLGGGYHFMQLEGMYDSSATVSKPFLTHMGTARNMNVSPTTFEDNHFVAYPTISPITVNRDLEFDLIMNVEEWYQNPYQWDFNVYSVMIMPNYDAQRKLNLNGPSVFTIEL